MRTLIDRDGDREELSSYQEIDMHITYAIFGGDAVDLINSFACNVIFLGKVYGCDEKRQIQLVLGGWGRELPCLFAHFYSTCIRMFVRSATSLKKKINSLVGFFSSMYRRNHKLPHTRN